MQITALREQLHMLIDNSPEDRLLELYDLLHEEYSDEFKAQLEDEYADYKKTGEIISKETVNKAIEEMLHYKNKA